MHNAPVEIAAVGWMKRAEFAVCYLELVLSYLPCRGRSGALLLAAASAAAKGSTSETGRKKNEIGINKRAG